MGPTGPCGPAGPCGPTGPCGPRSHEGAQLVPLKVSACPVRGGVGEIQGNALQLDELVVVLDAGDVSMQAVEEIPTGQHLKVGQDDNILILGLATGHDVKFKSGLSCEAGR